MRTPTSTALDTLLGELLSAPPAPQPEPPGPRTREEQDTLCVAILTDQEGSPESSAAAKASIAEMRRRTAALEEKLAEKRKSCPSYPRWSGQG